jgi:N-acetyl sugar amidotransferase
MTDSWGSAPHRDLQYCLRCCMPETVEGIVFDEFGICQACQSSEQKMHIDWTLREKALRNILDKFRHKGGSGYDCIVPISGGKDSTFQLHVITQVYGLRPLAVTFSHNWYSKTGRQNLENALEKFNVDHIQFTPNRNLVNRLARQSLRHIGDSCWHCHAGVGAFPLQVAVRWNVPLLIWGESIAETSGRASYFEPVRKFDREYFLRVSAKVDVDKMVSDTVSREELGPFELPSAEECERVGLTGIHLGDFIFWDDERQMEFVRDTYGWSGGKVEGTYKGYKSVECRMAGLHDYTKYLKRGFGRATDHASQDVRAGIITREEGFELAKQHDPVRPDALDYYLEITGLSEDEFYTVMAEHRHEKLPPLERPQADPGFQVTLAEPATSEATPSVAPTATTAR